MVYRIRITNQAPRRLVAVSFLVLLLSAFALLYVPQMANGEESEIVESYGITEKDKQYEATMAILVQIFDATADSYINSIEKITKEEYGPLQSNSDTDASKGTKPTRQEKRDLKKNTSAIEETIKVVERYMMIGGSILLFAYSVTAIITQLLNGSGTSDMWLAILMKLLIACVLAVGSDVIISFIDKFAIAIIEGIRDVLKNFTHTEELTSEQLENAANYLTSSGGTYVLVVQLLNIYVKIMKYSIVLELLLRKSLCGMAMMSIVNDGFRSTGVSFLKKYLACYIQIALMLLFLTMSAQLLAGVMGGLAPSTSNGTEITSLQTELGPIYDMLAIFAASVVMISRGRSVADAIVGV